MIKNSKDRSGESGNVLFLILIAVALFAALSYAVTQSTRSGGGSTEREQALLGSSAMTQYPTALRTSVIRMILGGIGVEQIFFNPPSGSFGGSGNLDQQVFHPTGGGAVYQQAAADVMAGGSAGTWSFNANFEIPDIGVAGSGGNDVTAFLSGVSNAVCIRVNEELGVDLSGCTQTTAGIPDFNATTDVDIADDHLDGDTFATGDREDIQGIACTVGFSGQASGCFYETTLTTNVFYSVLLER